MTPVYEGQGRYGTLLLRIRRFGEMTRGGGYCKGMGVCQAGCPLMAGSWASKGSVVWEGRLQGLVA